MRWAFALGSAAAAAGVIALLALGIRQSASRHMTLDLLLAEAHTLTQDRRIQLGGCTVVPGTIEWDEYRHRPRFQITDGERRLAVRYTGNSVLPTPSRIAPKWCSKVASFPPSNASRPRSCRPSAHPSTRARATTITRRR